MEETIKLVLAVIVGLFCLVHVVSNFVTARCSCKLCTSIRALLGITPPTAEEVQADDCPRAVSDSLEIAALRDTLNQLLTLLDKHD